MISLRQNEELRVPNLQMRKLRFECFAPDYPAMMQCGQSRMCLQKRLPCALVKQAFGSRGEGGELGSRAEASSPPESPVTSPTACSAWLVYCLPHTGLGRSQGPGKQSFTRNSYLLFPLLLSYSWEAPWCLQSVFTV